MKTDERAYLSVKEFAEKIGVHPNTIRRSIRSGRIQAFKIGTGLNACYRIPVSEIERIALFDIQKYFEPKIKE